MLSGVAVLLNPVSGNTAYGLQAETPIVFTMGTVLKPDSFNPFEMTTGMSYTILWLTYEFLYTAGPSDVSEPTPQLAYDHDVSEDGLTWTYYLEEEAKWHDGLPVTAHDVNFTFNMMLRNQRATALLGGYLRNVTEVVALDAHTVQITTNITKSTMLAINVPILPEHLWSAVEDDGEIDKVDMWNENYFPNGHIGSGPLILDDYDKALGFIRLLKFEDYHMGPVNVDEVLWKIFTTEDAMMTALKNGAIDMTQGVPPTHYDEILKVENVEGGSVKVLDMVDFGMNCAPEWYRTSGAFPHASTNYETANLTVRKAMCMAIDKTEIVVNITRNLAEIGDTMVPTATPFWHYDVPEEDEYKFDLEAAAELLENGGYRDIDSDGVRENVTSGAELKFDLYFISQQLRDELTAGQISVWFADIGIQATPVGVPEGNLYNMWFGLEYDIFIWNWQPDPDPSFILSVLTTEEIPEDWHDNTAWSDVYYSNPEYDRLYYEQLSEPDRTKRQEIIHEMQAVAYRDCPYSILFYPYTLQAYRTDTFTNYPDMANNPGMTPDWIWFWWEILPVGAVVNLPPENVDAGPDQTADVGEELHFTGSADDPNSGDVLTWNWTFEEPDSSLGYREGQSVDYTFMNVGEVSVTLTVTDSGGLSASDEAIVTVSEAGEDDGWLRGYVKTAESDPIEGATLKAGSKTKVTNSEGFYNMSIGAGTYTVNVSATGFANATDDATVEADTVTWLNFTLTATCGVVTGHVYDLDTEEAIGNAKVQLGQSGVVIREKFTDSEGGYSFSNVLAGDYNVTVTAYGYEDKVVTVTVVAGESVALDVNLEKEQDDGGGGVSAAVMAAAAGIVAVIAVVAALMLLKKGKKGSSPSEEGVEPADSEQGTKPDEP